MSVNKSIEHTAFSLPEANLKDYRAVLSAHNEHAFALITVIHREE